MKFFRNYIYVGLLALTVSVPAVRANGGVLARVGETEITDSELRIYSTRLLGVKSDQVSPADKNKYLNKLIIDTLIEEDAKKNMPDAYNRALRLAELKNAKLYMKPFVDELVAPEVCAKIKLEDALAKIGEMEDLADVSVITFSDAKQAEEIREKIVSGALPFDEAAKSFSVGLTASKGGRLGAIRKSSTMYSKSEIDMVFSAPVDSVTPVVDAHLGPTIFKIHDRKTGKQLQEEAARDELPKMCSSRAWEEAKKLLDDKSSDAGIEVLVTEEQVQAKSVKPTDAVLKINGVNYFLSDVLAVTGGEGSHGPEDSMTIIENLVRDVGAKNRYLKARGALKNQADLEKIATRYAVARQTTKARGEAIKATDEELRAYFDEKSADFVVPERITIQLLLVKTEKRLKTVLEEIKTGKDFDLLVKTWSQDETAEQGGKLGPIPESALKNEFRKLTEFKAGQISDPFPVVEPDGKTFYHIYKVVEKFPRLVPKFEDLTKEVKWTIYTRVVARKIEKDLQAYLTALKAKAKVEILQ